MSGRPSVEVTSVSRAKISRETGFAVSVATFAFDRPVGYWTCRVNSGGSPYEGREADSYDGTPDELFGTGRFGSMPFGSPTATVTAGLAEVDWTEALLGDNDVAVYARDLSGAWS